MIMKKLIALFVIALFVVGLCGQIQASTPVYSNPISTSPGIGLIQGAGQSISTPVRKFRPVRYYYRAGSNSDLNTSDDFLVVWDITASGDDGITVTSAEVTGDSLVAGVMVGGVTWLSTDSHSQYATADAANGSLRHWGWMQTSGLAEVLIEGAIISGDMLTSSGTLGKATFYPTLTLGSSTLTISTASLDASKMGTIGVALNDASSTDGGTVRVRVLLKGLD